MALPGRLAINRLGVLCVLNIVAFSAPGPAAATPPASAAVAVLSVPLHAEAHDGLTRLVFDFPSPTTLAFHRDGSEVVLQFGVPGVIAPAAGFDAATLHNLRGARFAAGVATLDLAPGVTVHSVHRGNSRVVDLIDPQGAAGAAPLAISPVRMRGGARSVAQPIAAPPPLAAVAAALAAPAPPVPVAQAAAGPRDAAPALPIAQTDGAAPQMPQRAPLEIDPSGPLVLAFAPATGAAAFRRGDDVVVVFDEPRVIDPAALAAHPGLIAPRVQQLPQAVVLRLKLPAGQALALAHAGADWTLTPVADPPGPAVQSMTVIPAAGMLRLVAGSVGRVIVVPDPLTGDNLLVGTETQPAARTAEARRTPDFVLLPSYAGVVVQPLSERTALHATAEGFKIDSFQQDKPLALSAGPVTAASTAALHLSRSFDLPNETSMALLRHLHAQIQDAAATPLLARLPYRVAAAQSMLALGMGAEAQALVTLAAVDDPRALIDPASEAIAGAAALLAGRLGEVGGLAAANQRPTDELRLWQALADAARLPEGGAPGPAMTQAIAAGMPLLLSYPVSLRRCLLPLAAATLLRGGDLADTDGLLAQPQDPGVAAGLDLARAVALQAHGQAAAALAAYDLLATGRDRSVRARAAVAALDLRVATHRLPPATAADAGERLIDAWRGDARERDLRLRVADWRGAAGQYRQQLEMLRETLATFPDPSDGVQARLQTAFTGIVRDGGVDRLSPLDLVALVQENTDLLPDGPDGEAVVGRLADRLAALDLPQQAGDVLRRLVRDTAAPVARAAFGTRLAALELDDGASGPALDALAHSNAPGLSPELAERRTLLAARAHAALGDRPAALAALAPLSDGPALLTRAQVHADAHDWTEAAAALAAYVAQSLPAAGMLDGPQSGIVLRLASATAQAGDEAALAHLHGQFAARLPDANDAALFAVLTQIPARSIADLPRVAQETAAARGLPGELQAMAHAP